MAATGACSANFADSASGPPTSVAEAAKVLNLSTFPLAKGAESPNERHLAGLSYNATGNLKDVFEFQRKQLTDQGWKELPGAFVSDQSSSSTFARKGFSLSVMVFPLNWNERLKRNRNTLDSAGDRVCRNVTCEVKDATGVTVFAAGSRRQYRS